MSTILDPSSTSDTRFYHTKHIRFDWKVDFSRKVIDATVILRMTKISSGDISDKLVLDTKSLTVHTVKVNGNAAAFTSTKHELPFMGSRLELIIPCNQEQFDVEIVYATSPESSALQWLEPQLTADKKHPFLFSQCQEIHARSLFPCQDTPSVKSTFEATVHVPKDIVAIMGAVRTKEPSVSPHGDDWRAYHFEQTVAIPSYLVAIACGDLASRRVGPRSSVWAEPSVVDKAAYEFAEMDKLLKVGEDLCGPYVWKVYDVLILPPTFPFGGMENPCLTFVSPTLLAGDRSLVNVVAHEIAHSWTGNLVTNCSWEHFWLNEGHTNYLERLIMEKLMDSEEARQLELVLGYEELITEVAILGKDSESTRLVPKLDNVDPDLVYNAIPYEKGSLLLYFLETKFGKDAMLKWLKAYVQRFGGTALDTSTWLDFTTKELGPKASDESVVPWKEWLHATGMPPWQPTFKAEEALKACDRFVAVCTSGGLAGNAAAKKELVSLWQNMSTTQQQLALRRLSEQTAAVACDNLTAIDELFDFSKRTNAELRFYWCMTCAQSRYSANLDSSFEFLNSQGRMKYTRPLYRRLNEWDAVRDRVHKNFSEQRQYMHQTTAKMVCEDIGC